MVDHRRGVVEAESGVTPLPVTVPAERTLSEPTLGALLTRFARTTVPARLYQLLWLGIPFATDFGAHGWWRSAAVGVGVAALGAWGMCDRWLWRAEDDGQWRARLIRVGRACAGVLAAGTFAVLLLELFLRLLGNAPIS